MKIGKFKKHLIVTCLGYFAFGTGLTVQQLGIKAGMGVWPTAIVFSFCSIFFLIVALTSLEKVISSIEEIDVNKEPNDETSVASKDASSKEAD